MLHYRQDRHVVALLIDSLNILSARVANIQYFLIVFYGSRPDDVSVLTVRKRIHDDDDVCGSDDVSG